MTASCGRDLPRSAAWTWEYEPPVLRHFLARLRWIKTTTATGILDRRRQFALLRSAGMPVSRLRALVLLQAGAPLVAVAFFSAGLGIGVAQVILRLVTTATVPLPDASLVIIPGVSLLGALGVVALMLPPLERLTRPDSVRME